MSTHPLPVAHLSTDTLLVSTARNMDEDQATGKLVARELCSCTTLRSHAFRLQASHVLLAPRRGGHDARKECSRCSILEHGDPLQLRWL